VVAEVGLGVDEIGMELGAEWVAFGREMLDPVVHDLGVAEGAEAAEEFARDAAEFVPCGVGVDFLEDGSDGTAPANGDAEVVDWVGRGIFANGFELSEDALHGFAEAAFRHGRTRNGEDGGHTCWL
jgi:hypothetical protein